MDRKKLAAEWGLSTPYEQSVRNFRLREIEGMNKPLNQYIGDKESKQSYLKEDKKESEDYGVTDWLKDTWSEFFQSMNKAQADDFAGQWQRAQEKKDIAAGAAQEIQNDMKVEAANDYFKHRNAGLNTAEDIKKLQQLYPTIDFGSNNFEGKLKKQRDHLMLKNNHLNYNTLIKDMLSSGMGVFADLKHKLGIAMHDNTDDESNSIMGYMQDWFGDRVTDASGKLANIDGVSNTEKLKMLGAYQKQLKDVQDYSKKALQANDKESKWYENAHKVSLYYKNRIARAQEDLNNSGSMWTADNLLYANSQQMGFSSSSWDKLGASMALSVAAGLATGGASTAMQIAGAGAGVAGALAQYSAGLSENNALAIEDLKTRVTKQLKHDGLYDTVLKEGKKKYKGSTDDEVIDLITHGDYLPLNSKALHSVSNAIKTSLEKSRAGINANFERNQYAVASDAMVDMLLFSGKGFSAIGSGIAKAANASAKLKPVKQAGKWVMDRAGNGVDKAYEFGVKTGMGIGGGVAAAGLRATGNVTKRIAANTPIVRNAVTWAEREVNAGRELISKAIAKTHAKDMAKDLVLQKRLDKYVRKPKDLLEKIATSGYSEAVEEGKQYENGQQWINNENPERVVGFFDGVMRDMEYGSKLIIPALGVPFGARFGIADKGELYANMAGGWLGGAMHTAMVSGGTSAIQMVTTPDKVSVAQAIAQNAELGRATAISRFTKGSNLVELAHNDPNQTKSQLNYFKEFNENRRKLGLSNLDDNVINGEEEYIDKLTKNSNNPVLQDALDDAGIEKGTKQFFDAVSAYTMYNELAKEDESEMKQIKQQLPVSIQNIASNIENNIDEDDILEQTVGATRTDSIQNPLVHLVESVNANRNSENLRLAKNKAEAEKQTRVAAEHGDETAKSELEKLEQENSDKALNSSVGAEKIQQHENLTIQDAIAYIGELKALQELKDDVTVADDYSEKNSHHDATFFKTKIQKRIDDIKKKFNVSDDQLLRVLENPTAYIEDQEKFDELKTMYKRQMSAKINKDVSNTFIQMLTGQPDFLIDKDTHELFLKGWKLSKAKDILKKLNDAANSDYDTIDRVTQEYEASTNSTQAVQQAALIQQPVQAQQVTQPVQAQPTYSQVNGDVANTIQQLDGILAETLQYDLDLSPDNMIDPELEKIGSVLMNAAFVNGNYKWEDAVMFVYNQLKKYGLNDRKISMTIPFLKQWYMAEQMLSIYDNVDQFSSRKDVISNSAQDIIDDATFDYTDWIERKKKELDVNFIVPSIESAAGNGGILDAQYKQNDKFGIIYEDDVVVYTVTKVDKDGYALDIDDEFGNPLCRDGQFLTKELLEALKTGFTVEQNTLSELINRTLTKFDNDVVDSTNHDFFVKESDGKVHLYTRSLYINGEQYEEEESKASSRNNAYNQILNALREGNRDSLKTITVTFEDRHNQYAQKSEYVSTRKLGDVSDLKKYLDYLDQFDSNTDEQYIEVAEALSNLLVEDRISPSLVLSQIILDIAKQFFNTDINTIQSIDYNVFKAEAFGKKYDVNAFMSKKQYDAFIKDLTGIRNYYENTLHYKIIPLNNTLYSRLTDQDGKDHRVAEQQNVFVAIDQFGKTHILNFATTTYTFIKELSGDKVGPMYDSKRKLFNKYESKRSSIEQYGIRLSTLALMLCNASSDVELAEHPIELIPIHLKYNYKSIIYNYTHLDDAKNPGISEIQIGRKSEPVRVILPTTSNIFNKILFYEDTIDDIFPRIEERCNVLNTIKEELNSILYNIELLKGSNNQDTLNKITILEQRVKDYINSINNGVDNAYNVCNLQQLDSINLLISTMFDNLQDANNILTQIQMDDVLSDLNTGGLDEESQQFSLINTLMQSIQTMYQRWLNDQSDRPTGLRIWQDCNQLLSLVHQFKAKYPNSKFTAECNKAEQLYTNIKNLQPSSSLHNMRSSRVRDGYGFTNFNTVELYYQNKAVATDGSGVTLSEVCGEPEFAEESVTFVSGRSFSSRVGKPGILIPITIEYKGKIFNVMLRLAENQHGQSMMMKITNLINTKKDGERIVLTGMDRTMGFPNQSNNFIKVTDSMLLPSGIRYQDIKIDTTMKDGEREFTIGLTKHSTPSNPDTPVVIVDQTGQAIYTFPKVINQDGVEENGGTAGKLFILMTPDYRNKSIVPEPMVVPIQNMEFNDDEIEFLIDAFKHGMNDSFKIPTGNGLFMKTDMTYKDVISMFIPYGQWQKTKPRTCVKVSGSIVTFTFGTNGQSAIGTRQFDMNSNDKDSGMPGLIDYLKTQRFHISSEFIQSETSKNDNRIFRSIKSYFKLNPALDTVQFGNTRVVFNKSDFQDGGMSGLAWMMKHDLLMTDCDKFVNPRFSFEDATLESNTNEISATDTQETTVDDNFSNIDHTEFIDNGPEFYDDSLHIAIDGEETVDKDEAERNIERIFGKGVKKEVVDNYVRIIENFPPGYAGRCFRDMIYVSTRATRGTEYHEAFHRVYRLLLTEKLRNKLDKAIMKIYEKKKGKEAAAHATRNILNEFAADKCQRYFMNHGNVEFSLRHIFDFIKDCYNAYKSVGSFRLYMLYVQMGRGKFADKEILKENENALSAIADNAKGPLIIHKVPFNHVHSRREYNTILRSMYYYISMGFGIDTDLSNIDELNLTKEELLKERTIKHKARWSHNKKSKHNIDKLEENLKKRYPNGEYVLPVEDQVVTHVDPNTKIREDVYEGERTSIADLLKKKCTSPEALLEMIDNFDNCVKYDLISYLKELGVDYKSEADHTYEKMMRAGDISFDEENRGWLDVLLKDTFEQSLVSRAQSGIKRLMSMIKAYKLDDKGKYIPVRNECGLFEFMDHKDVLNMIFSDCIRIKTDREMMAMFERKARQGNPIYRQILEVVRPFYYHKNNNANNELIITQLFNLVASTLNRFKTLFAHSERTKNGKTYVHTVKDCGQDYEAREFKRTWGRMLFYAGKMFKKNEQGIFVPSTKYSVLQIGSIFDALASIKQFFNKQNINAVINGYENTPEITINVPHLNITNHTIHMNNDEDLNVLKRDISLMLNSIGIQLSFNEFEYMLSEKYGKDNTALDNLNSFFNQVGEGNISSLWEPTNGISLLKKTNSGWDVNFKDNVIVSNNGRNIPVLDVYDRNSFASDISNYKYKYRHKFEDMAVLVTNDKRYYTISENNLITDVTDEIAKYGQVAKDLSKYCYNVYTEGGETKGALILKEAKNANDLGKLLDISVCTLTLFKTDEVENEGHDYFDISEVEDYLSKSTILRDGHIIFPTMSDKKTWVYIDGVILPGIKYSNVSGELSADVDEIFTESVNQLIEYAEAEYRSVKQTIEQVKKLSKEHPERMVKNFHTNYVSSKSYDTLSKALDVDSNAHYLSDKEIDTIKEQFGKSDGELTVKAANDQVKISKKFNKDKKLYEYSISYNVPNGCMFSSFNGVYVKDNKSASGERYVNFNRIFDKAGRFITPEKNLELAEEKFFSKQEGTLEDAEGNIIEGKADIIRRAIEHQTDEELEHIVELGLIQFDNNTGLYINKGLDNQSLKAIEKSIGEDAFEPQNSMSKAIRVYVKDTVYKSIMSINEVERVYSGNPSFFKFEYGVDENGDTVLVNRSVDEFKRLGGLISTGVNNNISLKGIPLDGMYNCSIINDIEVASKLIETIDRLMSDGEWRSAYKQLTRSEFEAPKYDPELTDEENYEAYIRAKEYYTEANNSSNDDANKLSLDEIKEYVHDREPKLYQIIKAKVEAETGSYHKGINVADGAAYISPEMTEWLLRMCGCYDKKVQKAFEILKDPKSDIYSQSKAYKLVTTKVIGAQKYTAYGQRLSEDGQTMIPYYNKTALFPVFKCIATGEFSKIYDKMQNNTDENGNPAPVHMLMMDSAVKIGAQGVETWSTDDSFKFNTFKQSFKYLRKQFNTDPHYQEDQSMGTQMVKVALASLLENETYVTADGKELRGYELLDQIMDDINALSNDGYYDLQNEFFKEDGSLDVVKFSDFLHRNLTSRDSDQSLIESIELSPRIAPDGTTYFTMNHPLAATSRVSWLQSILTARINEKVIDVNTKGSAFYQRSIFGMEGATIISDEYSPKELNDGDDLLMIIEDGPAKGAMDCVLSIDYFSDILKKAGLENASFDELKRALIQSGIIGKNAKESLIGYRIPTQAQSSIHSLRCVDVIPVVQHTIILPKEFTKITGSDFDIDKIFIASLDYDVVGEEAAQYHSIAREGDEIVFKEKDNTTNNLIKNYLAILKTASSAHIAHRSIDNDTTLLTDLLKKIESKQQAKKPYKVYDFYALRTQTRTKNDFITGKVGIGPFALNNNSQILTMLYKVEFAKNGVMDRLGHASLHRTSDDQGQSIMSWISALINAHVDIAKDPYITRLNVNPMTYNLVNLMIRTGYGNDTFYLTTQPVMKKMAERYTLASSEFMKDPSKSMSAIRKESKRNAAIEICGEENVKLAEDFLFDKKDRLKLECDRGHTTPWVDAARTIKGLFESGVLEKISINGDDGSVYEIISPEGHKVKVTYQQVQALVYCIDKVLEKPAQKLADVVKYSKIDTKKQGKNITEQLAYARGVEKTFGDMTLMKEIYGEYIPGEDEIQDLDNTYFNEGLKDMYEKSFIKHKTHAAIGLYSRILKDQVIEAAPGFQRLVSRIAMLLGSENDKDISKISQAVSDKLKSEYFIQYAQDNNIDIPGLVSGEHTIYDRLLEIQSKINDGEFGPEMRDTDGTPSNVLLKLLIADKNEVYNEKANPDQRVDRFKNLKFVRLFNALDLDSAKTDSIIQAWDDLLDDSNEELRNFARDLCVYAFFTSGDRGGRTKLFQYVPNRFRTNFDQENSYVNFIRKLLVDLQSQAWCDSMLDSASFIDDVVLNNYTDYTFVKQRKLNDQDTSDDQPIKWLKLDVLESISRRADHKFDKADMCHYPILVSTEEFVKKEDCPMYIKTDRLNNGGKIYGNNFHRCVTVYKRIGYKMAEGDPDTIKPIYAKINPRGYSVNGYNFYEYGAVYLTNQDPEREIDLQKWGRYESTHRVTLKNDPNVDIYDPDLLSRFIRMILNYRQGTLIEVKTSGLDGIYAPIEKKSDTHSSLLDRGASPVEELNTLQSGKTILSNEELKEWNSQGVGPNPRILVATEHSDPVFFANQIIDIIEGKKRTKNKYKYTEISLQEYFSLSEDLRWHNSARKVFYKKVEIPNSGLTGHDFAGLYIITKHDGLPIKKLLQTKIPKLIHFSITGLGSTKWEPGVMKPDDLLDRIESFIKNDGLDPNIVTIRIDPIVPGVTTKDMIEHIVQRASSMGIKRIRFSVMDCYGTTEKSMVSKGYDFSKFYDLKRNSDGSHKFHAKPEVLDSIANFMLTLKDKYDITLGTCAEPLVKDSISQEGCLSVEGVNRMLGTSIEDRGKQNNNYREHCSCFGGKVDALEYDNRCASACAYCYARHDGDAALRYYNEDGTLKDNPLTRTTEKPIEVLSEGLLKKDESLLSEKPKQSEKPNEIKPTEEQLVAIDNTLKYIRDTIRGVHTKPYALIQGKAGTGKTFTVQYIIKELLKKNPELQIAVSALSRKAVHVLASKTASLGAKTETLYTLAGASPNQSENQFDINPDKLKFSNYNVIFIDECSMITPGFQAKIDQYKKDNPTLAIIFLGDRGLLRGVDTNQDVTKAPIFDRKTVVKSELNTRVRQGEDSPILTYADPYWDISMGKSNEPVNSVDKAFNSVISKEGSIIFESGRQVVRKAINAFREAIKDKNPNHIKIVAGRNATVDSYNEAIHNALFPDSIGNFAEGDLVIYNEPYGEGKSGVENSTEGTIVNVGTQMTANTKFGEIRYRILNVKINGSDHVMSTMIIDRNDTESKSVYARIIEDARLNASKTRRPADWRKYYTLKGQFANLGYAYAITTHKSQGSTYDITVVDAADMSTMPWSNQQIAECVYTAITRSKYTTVMVSNSKQSDINVDSYANDMTLVKSEMLAKPDTRDEEGANYTEAGRLTGWKNHQTYTVQEAWKAYKKMPYQYKLLSEWAFKAAEKLGIVYRVDNGKIDNKGRAVAGARSKSTGEIFINLEKLKPSTILHETIHAVTSYWLDSYDKAPAGIKRAIAYLQSAYDDVVEQFLIDTVEGYSTFSLSKKNDVIKQKKELWSNGGQLYGLSSLREFIAEMSNKNLVSLILQMEADPDKKKSMLHRFIEGIARILHLTANPTLKKENDTVLKNIAATLKYMMTEVDPVVYNETLQYWRNIYNSEDKDANDYQIVQNKALESEQAAERGEHIATEKDAETLLMSLSVATMINGTLNVAKTVEVSIYDNFFSPSNGDIVKHLVKHRERTTVTKQQLDAVLYNHNMSHITTNIDQFGRITFNSDSTEIWLKLSFGQQLDLDYDNIINGRC